LVLRQLCHQVGIHGQFPRLVVIESWPKVPKAEQSLALGTRAVVVQQLLQSGISLLAKFFALQWAMKVSPIATRVVAVARLASLE
jgi:hypothetical protein